MTSRFIALLIESDRRGALKRDFLSFYPVLKRIEYKEERDICLLVLVFKLYGKKVKAVSYYRACYSPRSGGRNYCSGCSSVP